MRDLKFACPHCGQHIKCEDAMAGRTIACPACGRDAAVPSLPDEHHLRVTTGKVPIPTHAHGAPRASGAPAPLPPPAPIYSRLAIASIALSSAGIVLLVFSAIPGIILGYQARAELKRRPDLIGAELANAGIIIGYVALVYSAGVTIYIISRLLHHG
jgi:hypothetical protein